MACTCGSKGAGTTCVCGGRRESSAAIAPCPHGFKECKGNCACPSCGGDGHDNWFDRSICPDPCDSMHTRCENCGAALDYCPFEKDAAHV